MRRVVSIRLDGDTLARARERAREQNRTLTNYVEAIVQRDLDAEAGRRQPAPVNQPTISRVLRILRTRRAELERLGVVHASIFGSVARGDDNADSDVDVLVEVDPAVVRSIFGYGGIQQSLEGWIGRPVDLADKRRLRPGVAAEAEREEILAF
jgi:uncharacterized protein